MLGHHQLQHLGASEQADDDQADVDAFPEIQLAEREALDAALRIEADHREQEAERRHDEAFEEVAPGQRHDEAQAEHRQHQETPADRAAARADASPGPKSPTRRRQQRADERGGEHRAERPPPSPRRVIG